MLEIIHRDEHYIAIHKPAGLLVHRTALDRHETRFAVQLLRDQIGQPVHPVHRLDRGTSGVLLFALTREALIAASQAFEHNQIAKEYLAIVRGWPDAIGMIDHPLARIRDDYECALPEDTAAQAALTHYQCLARIELDIANDRHPTSRYALLRLQPETGRRHQIRRHLKHIAHPVIGDATYGKGAHNRAFATLTGHARLLLACTQMRLIHPLTDSDMSLTVMPSADFRAALSLPGWQAVCPPNAEGIALENTAAATLSALFQRT